MLLSIVRKYSYYYFPEPDLSIHWSQWDSAHSLAHCESGVDTSVMLIVQDGALILGPMHFL